MSKFDTHGGYFAPKDYMKVEAGGSHEENPNGGVQIGVDQEGTPNLLEEGEPVYKDYVYSDNIKASERFLKENNIPEKYAGELYSKIADSFFSEAENRPYDPISRKGLEAMLGRLADAQEGQKAYNEQRQLERELKSLSPDELAALEEMLAAGEQQAMEQQAAPVEPMMQQPMMPEQQMVPEQMPMMRNGGRLFAGGGDTDDDDIVKQAVKQAYREREAEENDTLEERMRRATNVTSWLPGVPGLVSMAGNALLDGNMVSNPGEVEARMELFRPTSKQITERAGKAHAYEKAVQDAEKDLSRAISRIDRRTKSIEARKSSYDKARKELEKAVVDKADNATIRRLSEAYDAAAAAIPEARVAKAKAVVEAVGKRLAKAGTITKAPGFWGKAIGGATAIGTGIYMLVPKNPKKAEQKGIDASYQQTGNKGASITDYHAEAYGGPINRFVDGGDKDRWDYNISRIMRTPPVLSPSYVTADAPSLYDSVPSVTVADTKKAMPSFSTAASQMYPLGLRRNYSPISFDELARRIYGTYTSPDMDSYYGPTYEWQYREDHPAWAEELKPAVITADKPSKPAINGVASLYSRMSPTLDKMLSNVDLSTIGNGAAGTTSSNTATTGVSSGESTSEVKRGNPYLSTFPRYAGAIGSGLLGLYNAFQKPDKYTATRYKPFTPSGRISLQDQVYNPVDQNMMMNQILAQGNSAQRALRNSGLGPSTAAAIVAQDNNITGNLGNTFLQTWDANNQRRNQVVAANNQNEAQRAQFDYAIDAARQRALSDAQMRNAYTDLQIQQLNNAAEGEKYAAVSNQISNALQALSGIGQENFAMNQVNSNPYNEGYGVFGNGVISYDPYRYNRIIGNIKNAGTWKLKCGGKMKK